MATRRDVLRLAGATGGAVLLGGCARTAAPPKPASTDLLYVATTDGLAVVRADRGLPVVKAAPAIPTADWRHLVSTEVTEARTRVRVRDIGGQVVSNHVVAGRLAARAATTGGNLVALATATDSALADGDSAGEAPYRPAGRDRTTISVLAGEQERYRFDLAGCLEPEAFDVSGGQLFLLEYLPPRSPDSYRVRVLTLSTGTVGRLAPFPKQFPPQDEDTMWGEGRQAVYDAGRSMLFTLYTQQRPDRPPADAAQRSPQSSGRNREAQVHAFVHTLSLADGWAYCVDLPEPFGQGPAAGHTIARSPVSGVLYAIDATSGSIAVIDPSSLAVSRVGKTGGGSGTAASVMTPDGRTLFLSAGSMLNQLDPTDLSITNQWPLPVPVRGIAAGPDSQRIYVGQPDSILALEPAGGPVVDRIPVSGLKKLRHASTA
jgi:hypothetical protein